MNVKPISEMTRDELRNAAKVLEIPGYSKMNKAALAEAVTDAYNRHMAQNVKTVPPMTNVKRVENYKRQNGHGKLTNRQRRACNKALKRAMRRGDIIDALWLEGTADVTA